MSKKSDLPIVITKNHRKGIMGWLDKGRRAVVMIVWLNKDIPHGQEFQFSDIEKSEATLWFCDRESIDLTIAILEKLKKDMPQERSDKDADKKCTYKETGCGSCKRQLDCPIEADKE